MLRLALQPPDELLTLLVDGEPVLSGFPAQLNYRLQVVLENQVSIPADYRLPVLLRVERKTIPAGIIYGRGRWYHAISAES
jgi:hypothetical protein